MHFQNQAVAPPTPSAGQIELYSNTSDKRLYYKDDTGTVLGPLAIQGSGSLNSGTVGNLIVYASSTTGGDSSINANNPQFTSLAAKTIEGVVYADQFAGADIGAKVNAAMASIAPVNVLQNLFTGFTCGTIVIPPGSYSYSTDIVLTAPVTLLGDGAVLTYTGSGHAVQVGPNGLSSSAIHEGLYRISGIAFKGGTNQLHGIYFNGFVTRTLTDHLRFDTFGNTSTSTYAVFYSGNNWEAHSLNDTFWNAGSTSLNWIGMPSNVSNVRLVVDNPLGHGSNGAVTTDTGIIFAATNCIVRDGELSAFGGPQLVLDTGASNCHVSNMWFEAATNKGCIGYGDAGSGAFFVNGATFIGNHFDLESISGNSVLVPRNTNAGLQTCTLIGNQVTNFPGGGIIVKQNNNSSQVGNAAYGNNISNNPLTAGQLHTAGGSITGWNGSDGDFSFNINGTLSGDGTHTLTLPTSTDTLIARATTDTLTNKTYDTAGTGNVFKVNGTQVTALTQANTTLVTASQAPVVNVTPVTVNANTASDQNLMAATVNAGTMNSVGRTLRLNLSGVFSTPALSTSTINIKVKLGSLTLLAMTSAALGSLTATNNQFNLTGYITTQTAGASAAFEAHGVLTIDLGAGNTVADTVYGDTNTATVGTLDSTASQTLQITIAFSNASGSNTATQRQLVAEFLN